MTSRFLVSGMVQGVGYRYFVTEKAHQLGLIGWVKNLPDGRVEVVVRGQSAAVESLASALHAGPRHARVAVVEKIEISDDTDLRNSFQIQ